MEIWKDVVGYEGLYQVSNLGRVKSLSRKVGRGEGYTQAERVLHPFDPGNGYLQVHLSKNSRVKQTLVHRLVAEAFIPNPDNKRCVGHLDEIRTHNQAENLCWCTHLENNNYGKHNKKIGEALSKPVCCIELDMVFDNAHDAAKKLKIHQGDICKCCNGKRKTAGGYHWQYTK